ncbi:MAG: division/cell wall cluster transcriptional repressor MraZ, partial [Clostridia bacterium]
FIITKGLNRCLSVYPISEWERFETKINALPTKQARKLQLFFIASAQDCELDAQGRVLVPQKLREYAGLDKSTVVAGMTDHIEIWDESEWNAIALTATDIAGIMEDAGI